MKIVDDAVAELEEAGPLFPQTSLSSERRPQRGGFMSLFGGGRPRYDAPPPAAPKAAPKAAPVRGGAQPMEAPQEVEAVDAGEDLEIPSFLRRLAN